MGSSDLTAPDLAMIEALAEEVRLELPEGFAEPASRVVLRVEDFPADEMLQDLGMEDPFQLTGLYQGVPLTQKMVSDPSPQPDIIWLFRRPILDEWVARGDVTLADLVRHVMVHELAHHFGWSDDDIAAIDRWWE